MLDVVESLAEEALFAYKGVFSYPVIVEIGHHIRNDLPLEEKLREKLFAIFVELAQNVSSYSHERLKASIINKDIGVGAFYMKEYLDGVTITTINQVHFEHIRLLEERIQKINSLDRKGLRLLKMKFRSEAIQERAVSGNVGLVEVALKAANPIFFYERRFADKLYAVIGTEVKK